MVEVVQHIASTALVAAAASPPTTWAGSTPTIASASCSSRPLTLLKTCLKPIRRFPSPLLLGDLLRAAKAVAASVAPEKAEATFYAGVDTGEKLALNHNGVRGQRSSSNAASPHSTHTFELGETSLGLSLLAGHGGLAKVDEGGESERGDEHVEAHVAGAACY